MRFRKITSVLQFITSCGNLKICIGNPKHPSKPVKQIEHGKQETSSRHDKKKCGLQAGQRSGHPGSAMSSKRLLSLSTLNFSPASPSFVAQK
jgi:hypothetical protein